LRVSEPESEQTTAGEVERERRLAKNEDFFRENNEFLALDAAATGREKCDFICECSTVGCLERIPLTRRDYEHVRERGDRFVLVPGHVNPSIEVVVERYPAYVVIEKQGPAGVVARADDPR
jgi:hypothetical protein